MSIKVLMIDDNEEEMERIQTVWNQTEHDSSFSYTFDATTVIPQDFSNLSYDLYVLDIDMPEESGLDVARRIQNAQEDCIIMFCSNHESFILDAFRLHTFFFIRKHKLDLDLKLGLYDFEEEWKRRHILYQYAMKDGSIIDYSTILYFEKGHNDLYIHLVSEEEYRERKAFKELLKEIPPFFAQASRNFVINTRQITRMDDKYAYLTSGEKIEISRSHHEELRRRYYRSSVQ